MTRSPAKAPAPSRRSGRARGGGGRRLAVRRARPADLPALVALEQACFQPWRRASRASLRRSLSSPRQSVWVVGLPAGHPAGPGLAALLVLWHHATSLRVYDVATHPALRGQGLGTRLMGHARRLAQEAGCGRITLEADPKEPGLVSWYQEKGFEVIQRLPAFYRGGRPAVRMALRLRPAP